MRRVLFAISSAVLVLVAAASPALAQGGPPGGSVFGLFTFAETPDLMYAATSNGVLRSDDAGQSWVETGDLLRRVNVFDIVGDPTVLYAAGEGGIYRSRDEAATWRQINQGLDVDAIVSLATDPSNVNIVYAGSIDGGIFKTTNGGDQWVPMRSGLATGAFNAIAVNPTNPQIVYAAYSSLNLPGSGAVFKSTNGGAAWTTAGIGPAIVSVALDPRNPNVLFFATSTGVVKSTDAGASFLPPTLGTLSVADVAVAPDNSSLVYAATRFAGIAKSTDGGATWTSSAAGLPQGELLTITLHPDDSSIVFAGNDGGGLFRSLDGGGTWDLSARGMHFATISALAADPSSGNVVAAVPSGGAYRSVNGGLLWGPARDGLAVFRARAFAFDPANAGVVYAGSSNPFNSNDGTFLRSTDGGLSWEAKLSQTPISVLAAHPGDGRTVIVGTSFGVVRTTDRGETFENISGAGGEVAFPVVDVEIDPVRPERMFVIVADPSFFPTAFQIFRTTDSGFSWSGAGVTQTALRDLAIDPADSERIYVASDSGIFRSIDGGGSYQTANHGLPDDGAVAVTSITIDVQGNSALHASTSAGAFRSTDGADGWQMAGSGLADQTVLRLVADPTRAGVVFAATVGGGVYKTSDSGESWAPTGGVPFLTSEGIVNAADFTGGGVAPGEIVSIFGAGLGPSEGVQPGLDPETGKLAISAAGVRVFFNDIPAPLFFVRSDQLNVQAPFELAGLDEVTVRVEFEGAVSARATVPVVESRPGLFSAVLNQDFSVNAEAMPESAGRVVQLFATGQGLVEPAVTTGEVAPLMPPFPLAVQDVRLTIGGRPAVVSYAGLAPGFVGLLQINAQIDASVPPGPAEVVLEIGGEAIQVTGTVWVN